MDLKIVKRLEILIALLLLLLLLLLLSLLAGALVVVVTSFSFIVAGTWTTVSE